jgi:hypothetical protein
MKLNDIDANTPIPLIQSPTHSFAEARRDLERADERGSPCGRLRPPVARLRPSLVHSEKTLVRIDSSAENDPYEVHPAGSRTHSQSKGGGAHMRTIHIVALLALGACVLGLTACGGELSDGTAGPSSGDNTPIDSGAETHDAGQGPGNVYDAGHTALDGGSPRTDAAFGDASSQCSYPSQPAGTDTQCVLCRGDWYCTGSGSNELSRQPQCPSQLVNPASGAPPVVCDKHTSTQCFECDSTGVGYVWMCTNLTDPGSTTGSWQQILAGVHACEP